jgi:hypothetical protein
MNSAYIQTASLASGPKPQHRVMFTNLSSQQQTPGALVPWFQTQGHTMQPMPFNHDQVAAAHQAPFGEWMRGAATNVSDMDKNETLGAYFGEQTRSTKSDFLTPTQRVWGVPFSSTELRATDMF